MLGNESVEQDLSSMFMDEDREWDSPTALLRYPGREGVFI
jgi:hypothetical protein